MRKSTEAATVERAIALRGELELAAELDVSVNRLFLMAAGRAEVPAYIYRRVSAIATDGATLRIDPTPR